MKRPVPGASLAVAALLALLVAGCGGGSSSTSAPSRSAPPGGPAGSKVTACKGADGLRATAVECASARKVMSGWRSAKSCALAKGESRGACSVGGFRCQSVRTDKGVSVSCARPGEAIAFVRGGG